MLMLHKLLSLSLTTVAKQLVLVRLTQLRQSGSLSQSPIGLMYGYLQEYNLEWMAHQVLDSGIAPSYTYWKRTVQHAVMSKEDTRQAIARQMHPSLTCYDIAVDGIEMCRWWKLAIAYPIHREKCRHVMSFICAHDARYRLDRCQLCSSFEAETVMHLVAHCSHFSAWRATAQQNMSIL